MRKTRDEAIVTSSAGEFTVDGTNVQPDGLMMLVTPHFEAGSKTIEPWAMNCPRQAS
jgi:hypothetical protein